MRSVTLLNHFWLLIAAGLFSLCTTSRGQEPSPVAQVPVAQEYREQFSLPSRDSVVLLKHEFVISGSERVFLDSLPLRPKVEYTLNFRSGKLTLHREQLRSAATDTGSRQSLSIEYRALPLTFKPSYSHRE